MAEQATTPEQGEEQTFLEKFAEVSAKIGNQVHLRTLRDAFATIMPLYILAGVAVLINNVVFPLFFAAKSPELLAVQYWGNSLTQGTLNVAAIILTGLIGYCFARNKRFDNKLSCVVVCIAALVVMMPQTVTATLGTNLVATNSADKLAASVNVPLATVTAALGDGYAITAADASGVLSFSNTGANGLFGAIIIGLLATTLFVKLSGIDKLKVNLGEGVPPAVADSFNVMIPMLLTLSIFGLIAALLHGLFATDMMALIAAGVSNPLKGLMNAGPFAVIIIYTLANLLFCLGIHQSTISGVLAEPILTMLIVDNMATFASGGAIQPDHYMNMQIINTFALIGGSGCTLMLLLDTFIFSKSKVSKNIGKLAILPGIFNINEPVIYGYPIVYNLPLMIPFVLLPDILIAATYGLTCAGIISPCVVMVPWTTPVFISGFLATAGDIRAVIWQVVEVAFGMAFYLPFMKVHERVQAKQALEAEQAEGEIAA
ncbi:MAG: PTS transporter subunit EIIC [Atopobiaceae bacterium]|jgi:PTS system cellobiose-specific IIC component|nr:PTS transporter subunit EIIC [Atopobiaceae bacterium]